MRMHEANPFFLYGLRILQDVTERRCPWMGGQTENLQRTSWLSNTSRVFQQRFMEPRLFSSRHPSSFMRPDDRDTVECARCVRLPVLRDCWTYPWRASIILGHWHQIERTSGLGDACLTACAQRWLDNTSNKTKTKPQAPPARWHPDV